MEKDKRKNNNQRNQNSQSKPKNSYTEKLRKASRKPGENKFARNEEGGGRGGGGGARKGDGGGGGHTKDRGRGTGGEGGSSKKPCGHYIDHGQFPDYFPPPEVIKGLKNQTLIEGVLRINPKNYEDAFISSPEVKLELRYLKTYHS